jgi:tubulin epsilon
MIFSLTGAGNNFAHGHYVYGPQYRNKFEESLRKNIEHCDSLQTFFLIHSLGILHSLIIIFNNSITLFSNYNT